ncbi:MAG: SDR family oxidoreductase, partial [Microbacterium gubbeenense]
FTVTATDLELPRETGAHDCRALDVTDADAVERVVSEAWESQGPVDLLVNAAGVHASHSVLETDPEVWDRLFAVNARGVFLTSRAVGSRMSARGSGVILTIASNAAVIPRAGMAAYAASKAAASSITRSLGLELGRRGVRCNVVSPGTTRTRMIEALGEEEVLIDGSPTAFRTAIPLGRIAEPEDIAETVAFLGSDRARHITLQEVVIDGGASQR